MNHLGEPIVGPDGCQCEQWEGTEKGFHNDICVHKSAWEAAHPETLLAEDDTSDASDTLVPAALETEAQSRRQARLDELVLYDSQKRKIARSASPEEIQEIQSKDVPLLTIGETDYLVISRAEVLFELEEESPPPKPAAYEPQQASL
jgi:hypothetical protein